METTPTVCPLVFKYREYFLICIINKEFFINNILFLSF